MGLASVLYPAHDMMMDLHAIHIDDARSSGPETSDVGEIVSDLATTADQPHAAGGNSIQCITFSRAVAETLHSSPRG